MPKITVDGRLIEAKDRQMILQACLDAKVELPYYCYHPGLSIVASCRICLVEVEGIPKLVPACQTPVRDGMVVRIRGTRVSDGDLSPLQALHPAARVVGPDDRRRPGAAKQRLAPQERQHLRVPGGVSGGGGHVGGEDVVGLAVEVGAGVVVAHGGSAGWRPGKPATPVPICGCRSA